MPGRNGESARRSCPTCVAGSAFLCYTTTRPSDVAACARIVLAAEAEGWRPRRSAAQSRARIRGEAGSVHPSPGPSLLTTSTAWNVGPSPPTTKVCSFRLPRMGDLQLPPTVASRISSRAPSRCSPVGARVWGPRSRSRDRGAPARQCRTLAAPGLNRHQTTGTDAAEWFPPRDRWWLAARVVEVCVKSGLTIFEQFGDAGLRAPRRERTAEHRVPRAGGHELREPLAVFGPGCCCRSPSVSSLAAAPVAVSFV